MDYQYLRVEKNEHIALVYLDNPGRQNALNLGFLDELTDLARTLNSDSQTRVVIFTGAGRFFSTGMDILDETLREQLSGNLIEARQQLHKGPDMIRAIFEMPQITIAAIQGYALGGAAALASACDFRLGTTTCRVGYPEASLGMNLSWGALPLCVRLVGPARAKRMVILGRPEKAGTLLAWGFLDEVVKPEKLPEAAMKMARRYAAQPPLAARMIKQSVNKIVSALDPAITHMDQDQFFLTIQSEDFAEGLRAARERRPGKFTGG